MCNKIGGWFRRQFQGYSIMHGVLNITLASALGILFSAVPTLSTFQVILLILLSIIAILFGTSLWLRRGQEGANFFLGPLSTIPSGTASEDVWNAWLLKMEALLRGRGLKRQSVILSSIISRADVIDRPEIAENFFRGLAQQSMQDPSIGRA